MDNGEVLLAFRKDEAPAAPAAAAPGGDVNPLRRPTAATPLRPAAPAQPAATANSQPAVAVATPPAMATPPAPLASAPTAGEQPAPAPLSPSPATNPFASASDRYGAQLDAPAAAPLAAAPLDSPLAEPKPTYQAGPKYDSHIEMAGMEIAADEKDDKELSEGAVGGAAATKNSNNSTSLPTGRSVSRIPPLTPPFEGGGDSVASAAARLLAPKDATAVGGVSSVSKRGGALLPEGLDKLKSLGTAGGGLAVVIALFVACMLLLRRGGAKASGALPAEAFAVLGRAPLAAQSFAHLLRVGNKLVLVAISPDGAQPLAEVTDPAEVGRLMGLCSSGKSFGPTAEFQQVMSQLAREPARGFLGGEASSGGKRRG